MDNQKDQAGTTPGQPSASRSSAPKTSETPASRKAAATPSASASGPPASAQSTAATPDAQAQTTPSAGADHKSEGEQTKAPEGNLLDTALNSGKKWMEDSGVLDSVNQLPQSIKDLGNRALDKVNGLSTTQKVVGGAILAAGIGWLATRKGKSDSSEGSEGSSSYNYGRQRDAGYGRRSAGYQAPDASTSRGTSARSSDSGSPYGGSGRFGSSDKSSSASGSGASARTDHGSQAGQHESSRSSE